MRKVLALAAAATLTLGLSAAALGGNGPGRESGHPKAKASTVAVYGDAPYGLTPQDTSQLEATPAFIDSINSDPDVGLVMHVGDIHSGKQYCTETYNRQVFSAWTRFRDPLVYTPGDNEWSDCHKLAERGGAADANGDTVSFAGGDPVANLGLVRSIFFRHPGETLGRRQLEVASQARSYDRSHPADKAFVENVMWEQSDVLFVSVNIPGGSNNDTDPWFGNPITSPQTQEVADRTAADIRWLEAAFARARRDRVSGLVIQTQADMWDADGKAPSHLQAYAPLVDRIATLTSSFVKPVLLFNGDSHVYRSDNPLSPGFTLSNPVAGVAGGDVPPYPAYDVPNFHRVVVHGSTTPLEWLRLRVNPSVNAPASPNAFGPFSWTQVTQG